MSAALRKGWCPGALRPMMAKDGWLVRLRITGGIVPATTAHAIADLATRCGNGLLDISARGNLQLRGVRTPEIDVLQDDLRAIGLLDEDAAAESVRNVVASPLAGLCGGLDIRPLTAALEHRLIKDPALHQLPAKFGFLIDDGMGPSLAGIAADIRFDWLAEAKTFSIGLGGDAAGATRIGSCGAGALVERAVGLAGTFLAFRARVLEVRRMRDGLDRMGRAMATDAFGESIAAPIPRRPRTASSDLVGLRTFGRLRSCLGLAAPFGRLTADMLHAAANLGALRLTPWRVILVPYVAEVPDTPGFIVDPADPRLAVAACAGAAGCARGSTDTHADATRLAISLPRRANDIAVHVSGCEKGCAKPSLTTATLVARDGRYDLVRDGRAGDPPVRHGLDLAAAIAALNAIPEPA